MSLKYGDAWFCFVLSTDKHDTADLKSSSLFYSQGGVQHDQVPLNWMGLQLVIVNFPFQ